MNPEAGADPRLERRLRPLLPVAMANDCRIISNLGAANPAAAARRIARFGSDLGCKGLRVAGIIGDDVLSLADRIAWERPITGELIGTHAYLGADRIAEAVAEGADVVVTGRVADFGSLLGPCHGQPRWLA